MSKYGDVNTLRAQLISPFKPNFCVVCLNVQQQNPLQKSITFTP